MAWLGRRGRRGAIVALSLLLAFGATATANQVDVQSPGASTGQSGAAAAPSIMTPRNLQTPEDVVLTFNLLQNASDPDGHGFSLEHPLGTSAGVHGNLNCTANGACTYTPFANDSGSDSFGFIVKDTAGETANGVLNIVVNAVNDPPTPNSPRHLQTDEDTPRTFNLVNGFSDVEGHTVELTFPPFATPTPTQHGSITCAVTGACTYTPAPDYFGPDTFPFTITDDGGASAQGIVHMTVSPIADGPAVPSTRNVTTPEDTPVTFSLFDGAGDPDGDTLTLITPVGTAPLANGSLTCAADGACTFTPTPNGSGAAAIPFSVLDSTGAASNIGTLTLTVTPVNDPPTVPSPRSVTTDEDTPRTFNLLTPAADVDSVSMSLTAPSGTVSTDHGTVVCASGGACTYTPDADYAGPDTFTYTITDSDGGSVDGVMNITVNPVSDPPSIEAPRYISTDEDTPRTFNLLRNAADPDGDDYTLTDPPFGPTSTGDGSVTCRTTGRCTYTPNANFHGTDDFQFTVTDSTGQTRTGTVYIAVHPVNDAPTVATPRSLALDEDSSLSFNLLDTAVDLEGDSFELTEPLGDSATPRGRLTCASDGACTYWPNANYNGTDTFEFFVTDSAGAQTRGVVNLTINPVADAPTVVTPRRITTDEDTPRTFNLLNGAGDADGDSLELTVPLGATGLSVGTVDCAVDGRCTFTPAPGVSGSDSFPFTVADSSGATTDGVVIITVNPVNDPPTVTNKSRTTAEDTAVDVNVLNGALDPESGPLTLIDPVPGEPTLTPNGSVTCLDSGGCRYIPNPNFNGIDRFFFTVVDNEGLGATGRVTITVTPTNDPPSVVSPRDLVVDQGIPTTIDVLKGAGDPDGDDITVTAWTDGAHGTVTCHSTGVCTYTPEPDFTGPTDTFTFTASDPTGASDTGSVIVTIIPANDPPVVRPLTINTMERTPVSINVVRSARDPEGAPITFKAVSNGKHGVVNCTEAGLCTYLPVRNFVGTDTFTYTITDGTHLVVGTVRVRVFGGGQHGPSNMNSSRNCGVLAGDPGCRRDS